MVPAWAHFACADSRLEWINAQASNHWSNRTGHTSVVFQDKMWVMGGFAENKEAKNDVWSSTDGKNWTLETDSAGWDPREGHTAVVFDDKMWVMGGAVGLVDGRADGRNDVWCSSNGVDWDEVSSSAPWRPRYGLTSLSFSGRMYLICGLVTDTTDNIFPKDVWSSEDGINWQRTTAEINKDILALQSHASVVFHNKMWVLGGQDYTSTVRSGKVYCSTDGIQWDRPTEEEYWGVDQFPAVVFKDKMWVLGGYQGGDSANLQNKIWTSMDGLTWTEEMPEAEWSERYGHTAVVYKDRIWVLGGRGLNDVWYSNEIRRESDLNNDGKIDSRDLLTLLSEWQKSGQE
jgi:hypothetical protein